VNRSPFLRWSFSHELLGTNEWFVIHHTDWGMETCTDKVMRSLPRQTDIAKFEAEGWRDVGQSKHRQLE